VTSPHEASVIAPHCRHGRYVLLHHRSSARFMPALEAAQQPDNVPSTPCHHLARFRAPGCRPRSASSAFPLKLQRLFPGLSNPPRSPSPGPPLPGERVQAGPLLHRALPFKPRQSPGSSEGRQWGSAAVGTHGPMLLATHPLIGLQNTELVKKKNQPC